METHLHSVKVRVLSLAAISTFIRCTVQFGSLNYADIIKVLLLEDVVLNILRQKYFLS
jgi:hypothetical protein